MGGQAPEHPHRSDGLSSKLEGLPYLGTTSKAMNVEQFSRLTANQEPIQRIAGARIVVGSTQNHFRGVTKMVTLPLRTPKSDA